MPQLKYDKPKSEQKACQRMLEIMSARPEALSPQKVNKRHVKTKFTRNKQPWYQDKDSLPNKTKET